MSTPRPTLTLASASGNLFAYAWEDEVPSFDGSRLARELCPKGTGLGLDGLFLLRRPVPGRPWSMDHWEPNGEYTFCSNGSRIAMGLPGAPEGPVEALSSGEAIQLRRRGAALGIRMPEGPPCGLRTSPLGPRTHQILGWIGNPQLIVTVEDVDAVDLPAFAPPLRHHPAWPDGVNVSVLQVLEPGRARIRTWERGVEGETLCCGTACATAGAWLTEGTGLRHWTFQPAGPDPVEVEATLDPEGTWRDLWLSGPIRILGTFRPSGAPWAP